MRVIGYSYSFDRLIREGAVDVAAVIRFHAGLGIAGIELADDHVKESELEGLARTLRDVGGSVEVYDVACDFDGPDGSPPPGQLERVRRGLARAALLGAPRALIVPGALRLEVAPALVRRRYAEVLRGLSEADLRGVAPMVANLGLYAAYCGTSAHLGELRLAVGEHLAVTYDVGNFLMAGEDTLDALERVAPSTAHVHLKDWRIFPAASAPRAGAFRAFDGRQFLGVALGEGEVPVDAALARLRALGYRGTLSLEYEGVDDPFAATRRSLAFVAARLGGAPG